mgnify:CR=1 FL=1
MAETPFSLVCTIARADAADIRAMRDSLISEAESHSIDDNTFSVSKGAFSFVFLSEFSSSDENMDPQAFTLIVLINMNINNNTIFR